jgi:hypothetical protein
MNCARREIQRGNPSSITPIQISQPPPKAIARKAPTAAQLIEAAVDWRGGLCWPGLGAASLTSYPQWFLQRLNETGAAGTGSTKNPPFTAS